MLEKVKLGTTGRNYPCPLGPVSYQFAEQPLAQLNDCWATCLISSPTVHFPYGTSDNTLLVQLVAPPAPEANINVVNLENTKKMHRENYLEVWVKFILLRQLLRIEFYLCICIISLAAVLCVGSSGMEIWKRLARRGCKTQNLETVKL